jgi:DNA-binding CsgD family transcriptional regulator
MGRNAKKLKGAVKSKRRKALAKPSVPPLPQLDDNQLEHHLNSQLDLRLVERWRKTCESFAKDRPDVNPEVVREELAARHKRKLDQLQRKHPDTSREQLLLYLISPTDEQPLWFNADDSEAMGEEDRKKVINEFVLQAVRAGMPPPLMGRSSHAHHTIRRQTRLTFKQWQVGRLTVQGLDIKAIASQLKISDRMVKAQLAAIRRKAKLTRNAEIIRWFLGN